MKRITLSVVGIAALGLLFAAPKEPVKPPDTSASVQRGLQWLVSVQGRDGGWGQDGGETSHVRQGERLESQGNDVANTAVALMALTHNGNTVDKGPYFMNVRRGVEFILGHIERAPNEGLAVTNVTNTQIQRKLGPFIDTFFSSMLLSELDGHISDPKLNTRVRAGLQKTVNKIQANQLKDGSWNISGGWAPILGTSIASRSLANAKAKGVKVDEVVMSRVDRYTKDNAQAAISGGGGDARGMVAAASPVALYQGAQVLEQLSRTEADRKKNEGEIRQLKEKLADASYVRGFGSMGGEEFFSYLNISDSLKRTGGAEWERWNSNIKTSLVNMQNNDGTWAGHHCITGRVAVTSAAILTMVSDKKI